jgi:CheY-like chemotaxis protein
MRKKLTTAGDRPGAKHPAAPTVLVIDDDPQMRRVLTRFLSSKYRVVVAENGHKGLRALLEHKPDIVLTDILMPEKEGIETIREIQERAPGTKIIAMSGGGLSHNLMFLDIARAFGADAVLAKPFGLATLMEAVERLLHRTMH